MYDNTLWIEKYRPKNIDDVIMNESIKKEFKSMISSGNIPHMIFFGDPGLGKTSLAKALVKELDVDYIFINGSLERSIDTIRTNVIRHLSTQSPLGKFKVVIIDEVDGLSQDAQNSLKSTIEQYKNNGRFIFTTNHIERVIDPLRSRLVEFNFNIKSPNEKKFIYKKMFETACQILNSENIKYNSDDVNKVVQLYFPDFRKIVSTIQKSIIDNKFVLDEENNIVTVNKDLKEALKSNDFEYLNKFVHSIDSISAVESFYIKLFNNMKSFIDPSSYRDFVKIISDHMHQSKNTISRHINLLDCLLDISDKCKFK